jgi:hypothetical protein
MDEVEAVLTSELDYWNSSKRSRVSILTVPCYALVDIQYCKVPHFPKNESKDKLEEFQETILDSLPNTNPRKIWVGRNPSKSHKYIMISNLFHNAEDAIDWITKKTKINIEHLQVSKVFVTLRRCEHKHIISEQFYTSNDSSLHTWAIGEYGKQKNITSLSLFENIWDWFAEEAKMSKLH